MAKLKRLAEGIYGYKKKDGSYSYYERVRKGGKDTYLEIEGAQRLAEAKDMRATRLAQHSQFKSGLFPEVQSPYSKVQRNYGKATIEGILEGYQNAGCPDRQRRIRTGDSLNEEKRRAKILTGWPGWKDQPVHDIRPAVLDRYDGWRRGSAKTKIKNGRTIDMELTTLRNALHWAVRTEQIKFNPLAQFELTRYQDTRAIVHCRELRPENAEELHGELAGRMFADYRSEACGWQALFEAFTGVRTSEALACRWDAKPGDAGHIDGDYLHLKRRKKGVNPWVKIHPSLRTLLEEMRKWHFERFGNPEYVAKHDKNEWFFPSYRKPGGPLDKGALAHLLRDIGEETGKRRTSHSLRAYYVTVRRSEGASDAEIAAEIGDKTGASIISDTYGDIPPNWRGQGKLTFLPEKGQPAWVAFKERYRENIVPLVQRKAA